MTKPKIQSPPKPKETTHVETYSLIGGLSTDNWVGSIYKPTLQEIRFFSNK